MADPDTTTLDPTRWPKWKYHLTLPPTMVATPEAEAALQDGYRDRPFSDEEVVDFMREVREAEAQVKDAVLKRMERELTKPVDVQPPSRPVPDTGSHLRPPPKRKHVRTRPRR